jgi:hypothetical protein
LAPFLAKPAVYSTNTKGPPVTIATLFLNSVSILNLFKMIIGVPYFSFSDSNMFSMPFIMASGLKKYCRFLLPLKNCANSGMSLGACPHKPTFILFRLAAIMVSRIRLFYG